MPEEFWKAHQESFFFFFFPKLKVDENKDWKKISQNVNDDCAWVVELWTI